MSPLIPLIVMGALFALSPGAASAQGVPLLQTADGPVTGVVDQEAHSYRGIPFAAPPVGSLRWRAPQDPEPWSEPRDGATFGSACLQGGLSEGATLGSEDCLYLNVWRPPVLGDEPLPVMFWIHGGGNVVGSSDQGGYNGAKLAADQNVIVVSTNYRMSFLGFFNHEALHTQSPRDNSGSFGLLDQMKALEWVQENAGAIGGDADRVTIFGESAGGMNSWSLILSPLADGLFHRAIIESGCPLFIPLPQARAASAETLELLVIQDGLATDAASAQAYIAAQGDAWARTYLYGKPAEEILFALDAAGNMGMDSYYGIEDGYLLPTDALGALYRGEFTGVPAIIGANRDEMKLFLFSLYGMGPVAYNQSMNETYGSQRDQVEALYPRRDYVGPELFYNRFTDMADGFLETACGTGGALFAAPHMPVWFYRFAYDDLIPPLDVQIGAGHAMEVSFVFGNFMEGLYPEGSGEARQALSASMQNAWTCFAAGGDPDSCGGRFEWPQFKASGTGALQRLVWDGATSVSRVPQAELDKVDYWMGAIGFEGRRALQSMDPRAHRRAVAP